MPKSKFLSKEDCLRAMQNTRSNRGAARFLRCSLVHYKKFARTYIDTETGKSLYEVHKNQNGTGIPKMLSNRGKEPSLKALIEGQLAIDSFEPVKIKQRLIFEGYLKEECYRCHFHEERLVDRKIPLIMNFKDSNKKNYEISNLELLCYNCSFLYATSPLSEKQIESLEDTVSKKVVEFEWEVDEATKEHLQSLGLWYKEDASNDGTQYISTTSTNI